jgi:uncharacterized membrane protein YgaE (UPF0421/DUF939 family)
MMTSGVQLALRCAVAATAAFAIAQGLKLDYPIFALVAAVIVSDLRGRLEKALPSGGEL